ncbi:unnamed protein product [Agarophyton chilense]
MDRINLSVAIIPMAAHYGWTQTQKGVVQAAFFLGYMSTQIAGGKLADAHGGRRVLAAGVLLWSVCTALTPIAADASLPCLLAVRVVMGVGEGVAMPAMNALVTVAMGCDHATRARALAFVYSGMYAGSIVGLLITAAIVRLADWRLVFYVCALIGVIWSVVFYVHAAPVVQPPQQQQQQQQQQQAAPPSVREMLSRSCVWAIIVAHFCCTWGYFVLLSWLPTYLNSRFGVDSTHSSLLSTVPWVAMFMTANIGGQIASWLQRGGLSRTHTRKAMQAVGFVGPALMLALLGGARRRTSAVALVTAALALGSFSQSGVYANHAEVAPTAAGTLLGVSNTFASMPGLLGVALSGWQLQRSGDDWAAVFAVAIGFDILGLVVYTALATSRRQW